VRHKKEIGGIQYPIFANISETLSKILLFWLSQAQKAFWQPDFVRVLLCSFWCSSGNNMKERQVAE